MKKQINRLIKNKTPFAFVIKMCILIGFCYLLIQLSNEARRLEEIRYIPDLQSSYNYALKYVNRKYKSDWEKLGHTLYKSDRFADYDNLKMSVEIGVLYVYRYDYFSSPTDFLISQHCGKDEEGYIVEISYGTEPQIEIGRMVGDKYISYHILYENGEYVRNQEMEEHFGIATDEVETWAESSQHAFEEELQKMHVYQINKARKRRRILINLGLILLLFYIRQKWKIIVEKVDEKDKPTEQCLGETIVNTINKFARWKYVLCGAAILFCIYILRPVISQFILFQVERNANIYIAYGMSAVVIAIAGCSIITRKGAETSENVTTRQTTTWKILQMMAGCILEMLIIRLGMMFVSDFYPRSLQFYMINGTAWIGAVFLMLIFRGIRYLMLKKRLNCNQEKVD